MKIVLVMDQFDSQNNGTTVTARRLAQSLREKGHEVVVLAGGQPEEGKICAKKHRIPFFQWLIEAQGMSFAKPDPALYYQAFKDADVVHFFMPFRFCREGEKHARQMRVPAVAGFHIQPENITSTLFLEKSKGINRWLYRWFYKRFYQRFDHIHCPSAFIAGQLAKNGYRAQTHVISNGVSEDFQPMDVSKERELANKFTILMIGRLSREKRQDLLIEAASLSRYSSQIQLVFAGKGPTRRHYERLGRKLENKPIMKFYSQPDLLKLINQADLYVHASDAEIEGISCLEAQACGLVPVISDSVLSATHSYALSLESLFEAGNARDLADKIDYWMGHPEEKAHMSEAYIEQQSNNRVTACTDRMLKVYRQAVSAYVTAALPVTTDRKRSVLAPNPDKLNSRLTNPGKINEFFYGILSAVISFILVLFNKLVMGLKIEGRKNLREVKQGAVTVSNHIHHLDCTMVKAALWDRRLWIVSLRDNFQITLVGGLIKALGAVPLGDTIHEQAQLHDLLTKRINKGDFVHYYPEGMLIPYYPGLRPLWSGAFSMAVKTGSPVVPMALCLRRKRGLYRLKKRPCFTLKILEPIFPDESLSPRQARQKIQDQVEQAMQLAITNPGAAQEIA